jgi:hypothetical protein
MSIVSGISTTTVGGPASGFPGSSLSGLYADQVVPCDWSNAASTPQPAEAPVSSVTCRISAPPLRADQSRVSRMSRVVVSSVAIVTLPATPGS